MKLKDSAQRIQDILTQHGLDIQVVEFKELTRTAQEAANVIGCEVGQIAKTLIFRGKTTSKPICVIASGKNRVDEKKIVQYLGEEIEKPDAEFVLQHTGFAIGGIPPIGFQLEMKPLVDEDLMAYQELWAAAGTPHAVFRLTPGDLLKMTEGQVANIRK
ncbi:MAG TPA: YbaK/EbsC family protein [Rhabdochlamydiaceae bacterium]|jgi:prolyl-tRNA editing enzyme YbaK/EbsC (Cys-tRNA(Pro) deacylase)|nr:YbaK/EbsC family protein [Rhabdochlamydiaceae bacterium]